MCYKPPKFHGIGRKCYKLQPLLSWWVNKRNNLIANIWFTKQSELFSIGVSFIWWSVGFYLVFSGCDLLMQDAPRFYRLGVVFLGFDVFFVILCVLLVCLIGIAVCCSMPCVVAFLYTLALQEGASDADLIILPTYKFRILSNDEKATGRAGTMFPIKNGSGYLAKERILLPEDMECCICLCSYENGEELHALPCNHHFHSTCILKWLKMNAICPLCKSNVLKGNKQL